MVGDEGREEFKIEWGTKRDFVKHFEKHYPNRQEIEPPWGFIYYDPEIFRDEDHNDYIVHDIFSFGNAKYIYGDVYFFNMLILGVEFTNGKQGSITASDLVNR